MSRKKKKVKRVVKNKISHTRLADLLDRYEKIKVVFTRDLNTRETSQERVITRNGACLVRYAEKKHKRHPDGSYVTNDRGQYIYEDNYKFSRYRRSCFRSDIDYAMKFVKSKKDRSRMIIHALRKHDIRSIYIEAVYVGEGFKKRVV